MDYFRHISNPRALWQLSLLVFSLLWTLSIATAGTIELGSHSQETPAGLSFECCGDPKGILTLEDLLSEEKTSGWKPTDSMVPNYGLTNHTFWFRTTIHNPQAESVAHLLDIDYAALQKVNPSSVNFLP